MTTSTTTTPTTSSTSTASGDVEKPWPRRLFSDSWRGIRTVPGVLYVVVLFMVLASLVNPYFGTTGNLREIFVSCAVLGILVCGTTVLLVSGLIDFAIGAELALVTVVIAKLLDGGSSTTVAIAAGLLTGVLASTLQGLLVAIFNVTPFIVSLGAMTAYTGLALILSNGRPIAVGMHMFELGLGDTIGVPNAVWVLVVVAVAFYLLMRCTRFGVHAYAIGGSDRAAFLAGIRVRVFKLMAYSIAGISVGIAGVVLTARAGTGSATIGTGYELQAIAAAVIGGTSFSGGRGTVAGAVIGVVLLTAIDNLLALSDISGGAREMVTGAIVVVAAIVDCVRSGKLRLASTVH
jgi:ribose/xylose/arabinose/galactoside ABC-type transport system permease subunit